MKLLYPEMAPVWTLLILWASAVLSTLVIFKQFPLNTALKCKPTDSCLSLNEETAIFFIARGKAGSAGFREIYSGTWTPK